MRWLPLALGVYKCQENCLRCERLDYVDEWRCRECMSGHTLWVDGCYAPCPSGEFRNGPYCEQCTPNCDVCSGPEVHECLQCANGYSFDFRGLCLLDCAFGLYPYLDTSSDPPQSKCGMCHPSCATCVSNSKVSCTDCPPSFHLAVHDDRTQSGECLKDCETGYFREASGVKMSDTSQLRCVECMSNCRSCISRDYCSRDECALRLIPASIEIVPGYVVDVSSDNWMTCWNSTHCVTPRTDCCEDAYDWYHGRCYQKPGPSQASINFQSYLRSGAGIDDINWDSSPQWDPGALVGR